MIGPRGRQRRSPIGRGSRRRSIGQSVQRPPPGESLASTRLVAGLASADGSDWREPICRRRRRQRTTTVAC
eukprot:8952984-Pyramimonas_sp.AAC.2